MIEEIDEKKEKEKKEEEGVDIDKNAHNLMYF